MSSALVGRKHVVDRGEEQGAPPTTRLCKPCAASNRHEAGAVVETLIGRIHDQGIIAIAHLFKFKGLLGVPSVDSQPRES